MSKKNINADFAKKFNCSISKVRDTCLGINTAGVLPEWYKPIIKGGNITMK